MCGIYSSIAFKPERCRIDIVKHRGPDGDGWDLFESPAGPVALGHRRLAIIDLSEGGRQPMLSPDGRYALVFNGEIYNYLELRDELAARGERFTTRSDTEVLLRAYAVWGERMLARLRGMFAFVIWDSKEKVLFAGRDRYGIKPLYFYQSQNGVALASEIKQLIGLSGLGCRMNIPRVYDFLHSGTTDHTAETMFDGVMQLRGGECLRIDASRPALPPPTIRRWYPVVVDDIAVSEAEAGRLYREALLESVRLHLRSDVPVGSCLSGGLDSSSIVCIASDLLKGIWPMNTFSACYAEKSVDEKPFMDAVVAHAGTKPHYFYPRADDVFRVASDLTWHQDEPFGSTSIFAQWCVFEGAARAGIKVMLDGQGADEPLAGYHGSFGYYLADLIRRHHYAMVIRTLAERNRFHAAPVGEQVLSLILPLLPTWMAQRVRAQKHSLIDQDWLGSDLFRERGNRKGALALASECLGLEPVTDIRTLCMTLTHASNLQMLLHWEDRNSMAHSIEARVPFLDHPLVELVLGFGNSHKIVGGDTKRALRIAMMGILPEKVRERRDKLGFATPEAEWFRGTLKGPILDRIEVTLRRYPEIMNGKGVRQLAADMLEGRRKLDFTLWRIVNLGIWGERFDVTI